MTSRHPTGNEEARHGECDMQLKEIVEYMAKALVDDIDNVDVQEIRGDQSSVIELRVSKADLGIVGDLAEIVPAITEETKKISG